MWKPPRSLRTQKGQVCVKGRIRDEAKGKGRPERVPVKSLGLSLSATGEVAENFPPEEGRDLLLSTVPSLRGFSDRVSPCQHCHLLC